MDIQVTITPNGAWGGEGSLGCGIGYGYLHRIPIQEGVKPRPAAAPASAPPPAPFPASATDGFSEVSFAQFSCAEVAMLFCFFSSQVSLAASPVTQLSQQMAAVTIGMQTPVASPLQAGNL